MRPPEFIDTAKANRTARRESYSSGLNLNSLFTDGSSDVVHQSYFQNTRQNISAEVSKEIFELEQKCEGLEKRYEEELLARANDIRDKQNLKRENLKLKEQVLYWKSKFETILHRETEIAEPTRIIETDDNASRSSRSTENSTANQSAIVANKANDKSNELSSDKTSRASSISAAKKSIAEVQVENKSTSEPITDVSPKKNADQKTKEEISRKERKRQRKEKRRLEREERRNARLSKESGGKAQPVQTIDCSVVLTPISTSTRIESPSKSKTPDDDNLFDQILDALDEDSNKENDISDTDQKQNPAKKQKKDEHVCDECGKEWDSEYKLKRHANVHKTSRPYKCKSCPARFKTEGDKSKHERRVHTGSVICGYCLATFGSEKALTYHQKSYH